jgi:UDP-N-acetylmuramyl pentapeptide phosphotransferase/UDP-N-acetylglucosamine-1-phosphate transferase
MNANSDTIVLLAGTALQYATLPSVAIAVVLGGKGVICCYILTWILAIQWLVADGPLGNPTTGMEGLAIPYWGGFLLAIGVVAFFSYGAVALTGFLPDQRAARRRRNDD